MKLRHFFFAALASVMALAACEQEINPVNPDTNPEVYTVKLACAGELDITQVPLTRFTPDNNDLYGIQVNYCPVSGSNSYKHYAYGLFDDISNVTIDLIADYKFTFTVTLIDDGKHNVYNDGIQIDSVNYVGYGYPFQAYNNYNGKRASSITKVSNEFTYSEDCYFENLGGSFQKPGTTHNDYNAVGVESYYGVKSEFVPTADGETISINLKRMVYGIKVVADDFLSEGTLRVLISDYGYSSSGRYEGAYNLTPENKVLEKTYSYVNRSSWYGYEELSDAECTAYINLTWTKDDGTVLTLKRQVIYFNRLKQTIVNVTFYEDTSIEDAKLAITYEDEVFVEEGQKIYTFGDNQSEYEF